MLLPRKWGHVFLDEGHKIRNPKNSISIACKRLRTRYRLLVTGSPIQNNLKELWSLFDFVFPGKLGSLEVFENEFANPISVGGMANAREGETRLAIRCAMVLRDIITPYILQRYKREVEHLLPKKTEQVVYCDLTPIQRYEYMVSVFQHLIF